MFATMISAVPSPKSAKAKSAKKSQPKDPGDTPMDGNDENLSLDDNPIEWVPSATTARLMGSAKIR